MAVNERLILLINELKISQSEFSRRIEKSRQNVNNILQGESLPSFGFLQNLIAAFPELNTHWLLTGEGSMWLNEEMITQNSTGHGSNNVAHLTTVSEAQQEYQLRALTAELEAAQAMAAQLQKQIEILTRYLGDKDELLDMLRAEVERLKGR